MNIFSDTFPIEESKLSITIDILFFLPVFIKYANLRSLNSFNAYVNSNAMMSETQTGYHGNV
jgi:hypothetical protein